MKEIEPAIVLAKLDFMTDYLESLSSFESIFSSRQMNNCFFVKAAFKGCFCL